ncbi:hypothetical protein [Streptomyces sp. NPDC002133]|uniref:hypothetical protein n=1 Tax=Streptomyces sp. NPDC002133 TaxID=3154409 RepID=UPI0033274676
MSWHWADDSGWRYAYLDASGRRAPGMVRALAIPLYAEPKELVDAAHVLLHVPLSESDESTK